MDVSFILQVYNQHQALAEAGVYFSPTVKSVSW